MRHHCSNRPPPTTPCRRAASGQVDAESLRAIGIDYEDVRATVEKTFGPGALESAPDRRVRSGSTRRPPFTYAWLQPSSRRKLSVVVDA